MSKEVWGKATIVACLVVVAWALAGCGGGSGADSTSTAAPLSKAQFVAQANRICKEAAESKEHNLEAARAELPAKEQSAPSQQTLEDLIRNSALPPIREMTVALGELSPPAGDEAAGRVVSMFESALKEAEAEPEKLISTDPFTSASEAARAYGLHECTF